MGGIGLRWLAILISFLTITACGINTPQPDDLVPEISPLLSVAVLESTPHDRAAFTQGLEIADEVLYESTGMEGQSWLQATNRTTGEVIARVALSADLFGEGITVVGDRIWQLTWRNGIAIERDRHTLAEIRRVNYSGEGWGLCFDGNRLVMSNGTDQLTFRDPISFAEIGHITVRTAAGKPVEWLNELECVAGVVWANVWRSDHIIQIDPANGQVRAAADLSAIRPADTPDSDVLNGIAAIADSGEFLVTGKNWPTIFRVRFTT